jgi:hypothetical protein
MRTADQQALADIMGEIARPKPVALVYCDQIAHIIQRELASGWAGFANVGRVEYDLHPTGGYLVSTKKTIRVTDRNGRNYRITVEEGEQ